MAISIQDFYYWAERHTNLADANTILPLDGAKVTPPPQYKLDTMRELVNLCGNPHQSYRIVHIAGSKGKGTTTRIVAEMLASMGYTVGCYLSPHILSFDERFLILPHGATERVKQETAIDLYRTIFQHHDANVNNHRQPSPVRKSSTHRRVRSSSYQSSQRIQLKGSNMHQHTKTSNSLILCSDRLTSTEPTKPFTQLSHATTFELLTLYALLLFKACNCRWVVLECGLGGRLDATNVIIPAITAITSIEKEHTAYLGTTYRKIATEKGGIIKSTVPVVLNPLRTSALTVLKHIARRRNAPVIFAKQTLHHQTLRRAKVEERFVVKVNGSNMTIPIDNTPPWSALNMRMSLAIMCTLFPHYDVRDWTDALRVRLPGRYTTIHHNPPIIVDGAHTPQSIDGVVKSFVKCYGLRTTVIFGCLQDKLMLPLVKKLAGRFAYYYFVSGSSPRFHAASTLHAVALKKIRTATLHHSLLNDALKSAIRHNLPILVCGSFYLVGEVMRHFTDTA